MPVYRFCFFNMGKLAFAQSPSTKRSPNSIMSSRNHTTLNLLQSPLRLSHSHSPSSGPTCHFPPNCSSFLWCLPSLASSITAHSAWAVYSHPISLLVGDSLCIPKYQSCEATVNINSRLPATALRHLGSVIPSLPNLATCSLSLA